MDQFKEGYRILMLINRKKESGISTTDRKCIRYISKNKIIFNALLAKLREIKKPHERIYSSVNERDINKAIRLFKKRQLDNDYAFTDQKEDFYCDIENRFISCLQNPEARNSKNFLIDLDSDAIQPYVDVCSQLDDLTSTLYVKETPNGFHIVTEPFDSAKFYHPKATILKDAMLFLE